MTTNPQLDHGPALTVDNLNTIAELTEDGMTARQIAQRLRISKRSVELGRQIMGVNGFNPKTPGQPVDEVAVMRAASGDPAITRRLHVDERTEAIATLLRRGASAAEIARTLNVCKRTVERHAAKVRAA